MATDDDETGCWGCLFWSVVILVCAAVVGYRIWSDHEREAQLVRKSQAVAADVRKQLSSCPDHQMNNQVPRRFPKVLVWDVRTNSKSPIDDYLPDRLRMQLGDRQVTVVFIVRRHKKVVGYYSISQEPAYKQYVD